MKTFFEKFHLAITDTVLRKRLLFTIGALAAFRLFAAVPIPGIDVTRLASLLSNNQFFGLLNLFSGGGLSTLSFVMLGVGPFITASVIMPLLTLMVPRLKALYHEEGEAGWMKMTQYSRRLTVPLAVLQALSFIILLQKQGVVDSLSTFQLVANVITVSAGSMLLMWLGELITVFGIGNGVSLIIFSGIVARVPQALSQLTFSFDQSQIPLYLGFLLVGLAIIYCVVYVTEAERPIPVTYAKRVRGMKVYGGISTYIPLRVNQAGVMPIIFALSILLLPQMLFRFLSAFPYETLKNVSNYALNLLNNGWFYAIFYFILVFLFTYFYTAVTFDPDTLSTNLQKNGAFIPGVRPGVPTSEYISKVLTRITLVGALFLGIIAVLPLVMRSVTGITSLAIGGTALLIVVSVVLDLVKKIDAQVSMREY